MIPGRSRRGRGLDAPGPEAYHRAMSQTDEPESVADAPRQPRRAGLLARARGLLERGGLLAEVSSKLIATSRRLLDRRRARRAASPGSDAADPKGS
jgi:hypothetical protein